MLAGNHLPPGNQKRFWRPWRVERAHQNRSRKNRPIVFGQSRTLELRNSARIVQTSRFAFSLVTRSLAHVCGGIAQSRENFKVGSIPVARSFSFTLVSEHEQMSADVVGGQVYEAPGVQPVFLSQEQAIDYTTCRACFRSGEIGFSNQTVLSSASFRLMRQIEDCDATIKILAVLGLNDKLPRKQGINLRDGPRDV